MTNEVPLDGATGCIGRPQPPSVQDSEMKKVLSTQACQVLAELRKTGELCDAIIKVDDWSFPIHRNILSACSPYFRALFTNSRFDQNTQEIRISGVSPDSMAAIIDYAYTRHVKLSWNNIEELLPAADRFLVSGLVKPCCEFLKKNISPENCIGIRNFAQTYSCRDLEKESHNFVLRRFQDVATTSQEFLEMPIDQLCEILDSDYLNVRNEEMVFDAVVRWIDHSPDTRKQEMARLLMCIRLGIITTRTFIEKVKPHRYVKECEAAKSIVVEALRLLCDLDWDDQRTTDPSNRMSRPRVPHELLFVVGGWSGGTPTNLVEVYDTKADSWVVSKHHDVGARAYHGCVTIDHCIFVIGGFDGVEYFNSCRVFNAVTKIWSEMAPMNSKRCYVSVAELEGLIYAMGGFDGQLRLHSVERFNRQTNQWSFIQSMNHQRSDARATTMGGRIYICGGFNGQECLNTVEYYDPTTAQWTLISPMRNRRSGVGVIAYNGMIYALGGFNGITRMNTGERYCPVKKTWSTIPEMYSPRSNFAIEVIDEMVFVIGGFNGVTTIFNVECYDSKADEWYDAHDLSLYRSALSACVVRGLPNVLEYIHSEP
ncbi:kelch-like protein 10 [Biomphalaria pfeifferi]|uniref:Kelch-like protein 10 n=1 Tax=Biomphalaria pfeifferi TaxID=112525 RepID=A0AAD8F957_BIOPF|nr:kelch-like protein 10 [Biomphalaria pfeifferi]